MKEFVVCISESANELTGKSNAWALYSFDNNFQIIKDFNERYNKEVQARIGSLETGGLSLMPSLPRTKQPPPICKSMIHTRQDNLGNTQFC